MGNFASFSRKRDSFLWLYFFIWEFFLGVHWINRLKKESSFALVVQESKQKKENYVDLKTSVEGTNN